MKKVLLALAGAALLAWVGLALADNNVINQGTYFKNAQSGAKTDAYGNAYVNEASKDRDNYQIVPVCDDTLSNGGIVSASNLNVGSGMSFSAESSAVIPTYAFKKFTLLIRVVPAVNGAADSNAVVRIAVQIRKHTDATGDTSSTFAWTSWAGSTNVTTADSASNAGPTLLASGASPNASEKVFNFEIGRGRGNIRSRQAAAMSWPDGLAVDLIDSKGQWYWSPYTSVRVRVIGNSTSGTAAAACPRVICKLAMGS